MIYKALMMQWGGVLVILLVIAFIAIALLFMPITERFVIGETEYAFAPSAASVEGMKLRGEAWRELPDHTAGLAFIAIISFAGVIHVGNTMYALKEAENEAGLEYVSPVIEK